jgi:hypothetical protein
MHYPIVIKKHGRPARSIFRVGFDRLRKVLLNLTETTNSDFIDVLNFLVLLELPWLTLDIAWA